MKKKLKKKQRDKLYKLVQGESLLSLKKKAWKEWAISIKMMYANSEGFLNCFTCGGRYYWSQLQAGHFKHNKLDFCNKNIHPQCVRCNKWLHGNLGVYAQRLIKKYGPGILDELDQLAKEEKPMQEH